MPKYRMMFSKKGTAKFISHLDLNRSFERTCRRAGLPIAYSQGFNPHPKINFAIPLSVGVSGEREFIDIELTEELEPTEILKRLNEKLPQGIKVLEVRQIVEKQKPLMSRVTRATYRIECAAEENIDQQKVDGVINELLSSSSIIIQRKVKKKLKSVDIRPGIMALQGQAVGNNIILQAELSTGSNGNVRPEELLNELQKAGLPINRAYCDIHRTGVYGDSENGREELW